MSIGLLGFSTSRNAQVRRRGGPWCRPLRHSLRAYVEDFGKRAGDIGVVAEVDGEIVGATWARLIHSYGFLYEGVPEIAIALWPQWRGRGVGTQLLRGLIERLREAGFPAVSLSAQRANRAIRLYQRLGFVEEGGDDEEALMLLRL